MVKKGQSEPSSSGRKTTAQGMRERGYEKVWKSALDPEGRRRFKFARATVERYGKKLPLVIQKLESRLKRLKDDTAFYEEGVKKLEGMKAMMGDWGKK